MIEMAIKKFIKMETLVSLSAFLMSICAIVISYVEVRVMVAQKEASVWPRIFVARNTGHEKFEIMVRNAGVGPALIKNVEVTVDGVIIKNWDDAINRIAPNEMNSRSQSILTNYVLVPGGTIEPIGLKGQVAELFRADTKRVRLKVCYCSIYEKCWVIDESVKRTAGFAIPFEVEVCEIDVARQFLY